ncbi:hypothetical protein LJR084_008174 [Variovorax sp. LjRoot84]|uniref:hypothetical protein n=1 Tax=Variovorax sp. LjRoot84 TaxID=3342340 RepID=UPI003ECEA0FA
MEQTHSALCASVAASRHCGDPLADAVIAECDADPTLPRAWINQGITQGRASLTACPPALDALLHQANRPRRLSIHSTLRAVQMPGFQFPCSG